MDRGGITEEEEVMAEMCEADVQPEEWRGSGVWDGNVVIQTHKAQEAQFGEGTDFTDETK